MGAGEPLRQKSVDIVGHIVMFVLTIKTARYLTSHVPVLYRRANLVLGKIAELIKRNFSCIECEHSYFLHESGCNLSYDILTNRRWTFLGQGYSCVIYFHDMRISCMWSHPTLRSSIPWSHRVMWVITSESIDIVVRLIGNVMSLGIRSDAWSHEESTYENLWNWLGMYYSEESCCCCWCVTEGRSYGVCEFTGVLLVMSRYRDTRVDDHDVLSIGCCRKYTILHVS